MSAYSPDSGRPLEEHEKFEMQAVGGEDGSALLPAGNVIVRRPARVAAERGLWRLLFFLFRRRRALRRALLVAVAVAARGFGLGLGKGLLQVLGMNQLCAPLSFFRKALRGLPQSFAYATWRHPGRKSLFQLDYFFMKQKGLKRVRDAGVWKYGVDSDHRAIFLRLEIAHTLAEPRAPCSKRVDRSMLKDPKVRAA